MKFQSLLTRYFVFVFFIAMLFSSCTQRRYGHMNFQRGHAPSMVKSSNDSEQNFDKVGRDQQSSDVGLTREKVEPAFALNAQQDLPVEMNLEQTKAESAPKLMEELLLKKLNKTIKKVKPNDSELLHPGIATTIKPNQVKEVSSSERKKERSILYILIVILIILLILSLAKNILGSFLWSILILAILITVLGRVLGWW